MKRIKQIAAASLLPFALMLGVVAAVPQADVAAVSATDAARDGLESTSDNPSGEASLTGSNSLFQRITNILLFLVGSVAVIMLVVGGFRYVLSGGDQNQVTAAKNTILYAVIGIIVAILAYAAVDFVVGAF